MLQSAKLRIGGQPSLAQGWGSDDCLDDCHVPIGAQEWGNVQNNERGQKKKGDKNNAGHSIGTAFEDKSFRNFSHFHS